MDWVLRAILEALSQASLNVMGWDGMGLARKDCRSFDFVNGKDKPFAGGDGQDFAVEKFNVQMPRL